MKYDYLIVGAGLYGSVFAYEKSKLGKKCLVIDKRNHIGGNCYTKNLDSIEVHAYGPHIFNTNNKELWDYINNIYPIIPYFHKVKVSYNNQLYSFPINLQTFKDLWGICDISSIQQKLNSISLKYDKIDNLEKLIKSELGEEIYEKFYSGYSKKQWGRDEISVSVGSRIPIRYNWNDNYHNSLYSGIPLNGSYTKIFEKMLENVDLRLNEYYDKSMNILANKVVYTGAIDEYYDYCYGELEYRSLRFETIREEVENYQGIAQINYGNVEIPYTRIVEHKWFNYVPNINYTYITKEYSEEYVRGKERYYPIKSARNSEIYMKYKELNKLDNILISGRLGRYQYMDMDAVIAMALKDSKIY